MKHTEKNKGFTMLELVVVVVVIGILAAIAVPSYMSFTTVTKKTAVSAQASIFNTAATSIQAAKAAGLTTLSGQDISGTLDAIMIAKVVWHGDTITDSHWTSNGAKTKFCFGAATGECEAATTCLITYSSDYYTADTNCT